MGFVSRDPFTSDRQSKERLKVRRRFAYWLSALGITILIICLATSFWPLLGAGIVFLIIASLIYAGIFDGLIGL